MRTKIPFLYFFIFIFLITPIITFGGFVEKKIDKVQTVNLNQASNEKANYIWWRSEKAKRQKAVNDYLKKNKKGWTWFDYHPVAISGIPAIMQRVLPDVFPEIWGKKSNYMEKTGLFRSDRKNAVFPEGYSWGRGSKQLTKAPVLKKLRMMISNFTCTACHVGRVIDDNGNLGIGVAAHDPLTALHVQGLNDGALKDVFTITNQAGSSGTEVGMVLECGADELARISGKNEGSDIGPLIFSTASSQGANPTEKLRIGSAGQLGIGGANYGTAGQVLKSGGSGAAVSWGAGSDLVAESSAYDMGSVFTNGVNADVIDSSTRRIEIGILSYSLSGSDELRIQLRTSAGNITSGYVSRGGYVSNASYAQDQTSSGGFDTYGMSSSDYTWSGWLTLKNYKDNYWYMDADLWADAYSTHYWIHGHVNLGAQIVGIRFTRTGSNSFDNGEFKIFQYNTP